MKREMQWLNISRRGLRTIGVLALLAVLAQSVPLPTAARAAVGVNVDLKEMTVVADPASVPAGTVTFNAVNSGTIPHELVVLKTDISPELLPARAADPTKVDEAAAGIENLGEIEDSVLDVSGATGTMTLDLALGKYVLICNVSGHYKAGMFTAFTVTGAAAPTTVAPPQQVAPALPSTGSGTDGDGVVPSLWIVFVAGGVLLAAAGGWTFFRARR
jgi:uncharacterized cupredoxin-like copper-binding protein